MQISKWNSKQSVDKTPGMMIRVNRGEALRLIQSLSSQLLSDNPNVGRHEFFTDKGHYFSIAVSEDGN